MSHMQTATAQHHPNNPDEIASYDARDLVVNGVKANIVLDGQVYTLRITRAGNLILTK